MLFDTEPPSFDREPSVARAQARVGTILKDKWRLEKLIGVGGMASVYAASHRNTKRVAIKILHPDLAIDDFIQRRFLREGYVGNQVGHRGAVDVIDDDIAEDGSAFLVMELLEGENFDRRMRRKGGRLAQGEVLSLFDQVLDTLAAAHEKGIVHRDLKPENLFLTRDGVVKVLDFGIARVREMSSKSMATQSGSVMGTPAFMAPEQARARWDEVDARSDLWSVGASMFTLLTGKFVHGGGTATEALAMAVTARAPSVGRVYGKLHQAVIALVDVALEYEKEKRFQDAREMQEVLRAAYTAVEGRARMKELSLPDATDLLNPVGATPAVVLSPSIAEAAPSELGVVSVPDPLEFTFSPRPSSPSQHARRDSITDGSPPEPSPVFEALEPPMPSSATMKSAEATPANTAALFGDFSSTSTVPRRRAGASSSHKRTAVVLAGVAAVGAIAALAVIGTNEDDHANSATPPSTAARAVEPTAVAPSPPVTGELATPTAEPSASGVPVDSLPVDRVDEHPAPHPRVVPMLTPPPSASAAPVKAPAGPPPVAEPAPAPAAPAAPAKPKNPFSTRY